MDIGEEARAGGGCVDDEMPDLIPIIDEAAEAAEAVARPKFEELKNLVKDYKEANGNPKIAEQIKTTIKDHILTDQVRGIIAPVLVSLFGGKPTTNSNRVLHKKISDCILDALMDDFSVLDYVRMVCNIYIKAYYDDNIFRVGLASVYSRSVLYVFWNSGVGSFAAYTTQQCLYLMSMFGHLLELANNHSALETALGNIIPQAYAGPSAKAIETIIKYLRDNATDSSNIKMMCAMALMGLIHRFHPHGPLDGMMRDAAAPPAAAAAAPPPAAAAAAAAAPPPPRPDVIDSLFNSMLQPLLVGSGLVVETVNKYLAGLLKLLSRIAYGRVGVIAGPEDRISRRVSGYICRHIVDYLATTIDAQGALLQEGVYSLLKAKIIMDAVIKTPQLMDMTVEQSETHILTIAGSIRSNVIDKLKTLRVGNPDEAADTKELEDCCPMFKSMLLERNVMRFEMTSNLFMLRQLLPESSGPVESSQNAVHGDSQTLAERVGTVEPDILTLLNQGQTGLFFTKKEKQDHRVRELEQGLISKGVDMVLVGPGRVFNSLKQLAYTGAVCGFFGFSKQVLLEGQHLLTAGKTPAPGFTGPAIVSSAPLSAQYIAQINIINDVIKEVIKDKAPDTGITEDIRKEIRENLRTTLSNGSSDLSDTELDELLNKIYYFSKIDEAERQGIQGTAVNFFHNGWRMIRNMDATSGLKQERDAKGNLALVRFLKGSNEPSTLGSALAPAKSVVRNVSKSIWNSVADFKDVICRRLLSSSEEAGAARVDLLQAVGAARVDRLPEGEAANVLAANVLEQIDEIVIGIEVEEDERLKALQQQERLDDETRHAKAAVQEHAAAEEHAAAKANAVVASPVLTTYQGVSTHDTSSAADNMGEVRDDDDEHADKPKKSQRDNDDDDDDDDELKKLKTDGGKSRRKSRKNVKKTTRRNKKIVRKSSKNTKQRRSSLRRRSSRKSRK